jgi:hypothetical protein
MTRYEEYKQRLERLELFLEYAQHEIYRLTRDGLWGLSTRFRANPAVEILRRDLGAIYAAGDLGYAQWAANAAVTKAYIIEIDGALLIATNDGTTGATEPVVPAQPGGVVIDGDVTWERIYDSPITQWDQRFANLLTTHGLIGRDYEHYNCLRPARIWQPGDTIDAGDVIIHRYEDITANDTVHTYPTSPPVDTSGACLNAGPPIGGPRPPFVPDNYYEVCANTWIPIPTFSSFTTTDYTAKFMVVLFWCSAAGTVGDAPPDYLDTSAYPAITYNDVAPNPNGTAELRVRGVYDYADGTYVATTLNGFPEQLIPCA